MIATNAFGMGLNDKKVRLVIHYSFPLSIGKTLLLYQRNKYNSIINKTNLTI